MQTFKLFVDSEKVYACRPPSVGAAREYARLLVQSAAVPAVDRYAIAESYGWGPGDVSDAIKYEEYQKRRACLLFPDAAAQIAANVDALNTEEVGRAEAFFTRATGVRLREPAVSFSDLSAFLTQALSATPQTQQSPGKQD